MLNGEELSIEIKDFLKMINKPVKYLYEREKRIKDTRVYFDKKEGELYKYLKRQATNFKKFCEDIKWLEKSKQLKNLLIMD